MNCRINKTNDLQKLFSLGDISVSDFLTKEQLNLSNKKVPLSLCLSKSSGLVQLEHTADFDTMYSRYWYHSGTNKTMIKALEDIVLSINDLINLTINDVWLDIGCNDGTLLSFVKCFKVGIDPAKNNCIKSKNIANIVINDYFNKESYYSKITIKPKVITSIAMFYDLPDPVKFCKDIYDILDDDGLWVIQMSYLPLMLNQMAFDNICHEHLEYYDLHCLKNLLDKTNFKIVDCQLNDINGGSFRVYVKKINSNDSTFGTAPYRDVCNFRIDSLLQKESAMPLREVSFYKEWFNKIEKLKYKTKNFINDEVSKGKSIWGYGASTKGNTLLQYFNLDYTLINGIAERQEQKYGLYTIATNIPIYSEEYVRSQKPDYMLILPWHFINEFCNREKDYLNSGGKFIVPCPQLKIIDKDGIHEIL